ncbi:hypothetical protein OOJ96_10305 [Pseudomonas sp. 15FMM2]|uniref:Uncharacterized protein n=1 Tax=Pseudomonas imrae TaxID=2992837 RepID=A0ACC7PJC8_9PSED
MRRISLWSDSDRTTNYLPLPSVSIGDRPGKLPAKDLHPEEDDMGFYRESSVFQAGVV